jgi:Tfp pilus assembly protein PilF
MSVWVKEPGLSQSPICGLSLLKWMPMCKKIFQFLLICIFSTAIFSSTGLCSEVNKNAIVVIATYDQSGETISTGSAFLVDPEGTLVTNYHVLVDAHSANIVFLNGQTVPVEKIVKVDRTKDFAILKIKKDFYSTLELGDSDTIKNFDYTSALGYLTEDIQEQASGMRGSMLQTYGFLLGSHPQAYPDFKYNYTSTRFGPGFSGGPLVDQNNKVIGIATIEGRSINLALPINYVKPFLADKGGMTFAELIIEDSVSSDADYFRGHFSLYAKGDAKTAIRFFEKTLLKNPNHILAHYDMAAAFRDQGKSNEAIARYQKVVEINPKFSEALSNLGGFYFRDGQVDKAIESFQSAIAAYPNFIQGLSNLGAAFNKVGKSKEAIPHLQKALKLDPEFAIAYYNLGNAYFATEQLDKAEQSFNHAISQGIDFLSLHWKLVSIHEKRGHSGKAIDQLNLILQIDPMDDEAQNKINELTASSNAQ